MRRDQGDEPGQLLDLACGPAQASGIMLGVDPGPGQSRAVDHAVQQSRQAGQDRDVDPFERALELAVIDMAHGAALTMSA